MSPELVFEVSILIRVNFIEIGDFPRFGMQLWFNAIFWHREATAIRQSCDRSYFQSMEALKTRGDST
jgi:hypothetical protein